MRKIHLLAAAMMAILVAGCGRSKPPAVADLQQTTLTATQLAEPLTPPEDQYQGRSVAQWESSLQSLDPVARKDAGQALAQLGSKGYPSLLRGLDSNNRDTRLTSLQSFSRQQMVARGHETLPRVVRLLQEREPAVRRMALLRIGWFGSQAQEALPALRAAADRDPDADVRQLAVEIIVGMNSATNKMIELLRDSNPDVRKRAAGQLQFASVVSAVPALEDMAKSDADPSCRIAAQTALRALRQR